MPTQDEMILAAKLVHAGIVDKVAAHAVLKERDASRSQIGAPALPDLLVRKGLVTRTELMILRDRPLEEIQPFPKYEVHGKLAEGGMSQVYRATYKPLGALVALKVMKPEISRQERFLLRFRREAGLLMKLEHEGIVRGYDLADQERVWYCAMEFAEGRSLQEIVEERRRLPEAEAVPVAAQVLRALAYLDGRGIVHRDIKPGNVVVDAKGRARIIDLGLCLLRGGMREDGAEGTTVGTVEFLSPEQARGLADVDGRTDLYAVGCLLHQCVTGAVPFKGGSDEETLALQVLGKFDPSRLRAAKASDALISLVSRLLAKEREERPRSAAALLEEMEATFPVLAPPAPAPLPAAAPSAAPAAPIFDDEPDPEDAGPAMPKLLSKKDREKERDAARRKRR